jgi:hypothetical protein
VAKAPRWGWLEYFTIAQTLMPTLLFIPGITAVRTATRIAAYLLGLVFWGGVGLSGKKAVTTGSFPAQPWLAVASVWLLLSIGGSGAYSLTAAAGHATLYIAILSPAFWAGSAVASPYQLKRVLTLLFICNALSATLGVGQVFYPDRLNPPVIPIMALSEEGAGQLWYETADGRKILRPCGLTDTPGAAAPAGAAAALIGLCLALRPLPLWRRGACLGFAFMGVAVIYYTQVRSALVMLSICLATVTALLMIRGDFRNAGKLVTGGVVMLGAALAWVARTMGSRVFERFGTLVSDNPINIISYNRGVFLADMVTSLGKYPLGYGLGWWGMVHQAFRNPNRTSTVWVEVMPQAWAVDGGYPLLIAYGGAVIVAMYDSLRIVLTTEDRELGFWGALVVAQNLASAAACLTFPTFLSPLGMQFWMLAAVLHAASAQVDAARAATPAARPAQAPPRPRPAV